MRSSNNRWSRIKAQWYEYNQMGAVQVSRQFVPLVCGRTVAIMDQHAAAERVRLEQLQQEVACLLDALSPAHSCGDAHNCWHCIVAPWAANALIVMTVGGACI